MSLLIHLYYSDTNSKNWKNTANIEYNIENIREMEVKWRKK